MHSKETDRNVGLVRSVFRGIGSSQLPAASGLFPLAGPAPPGVAVCFVRAIRQNLSELLKV